MPRHNPEDPLFDWKLIGMDLRRARVGPTQVSVRLRIPHQTVCDWFNKGVEPSFTNGTNLMRLWESVMFAATCRNTGAVAVLIPLQRSDNSAFVGEEL